MFMHYCRTSLPFHRFYLFIIKSKQYLRHSYVNRNMKRSLVWPLVFLSTPSLILHNKGRVQSHTCRIYFSMLIKRNIQGHRHWLCNDKSLINYCIRQSLCISDCTNSVLSNRVVYVTSNRTSENTCYSHVTER